ncbi:MAG: hypothetical protein PHU27_09625 [Salinivirgaceae bacterium]|nr:hypothetical protein [Salinivirgaceae bacterium]MDD4745998.1 hypothetical protein [Salinivirgaceae bacterium]MDY0281549.1 hypothetical protein [Salinivirgaceae bacterium]
MKITKEILIVDLIDLLPESATYLMNQHIKCVACGEPIWGTLEQASKQKGYNDNDIERFVRELNAMLP